MNRSLRPVQHYSSKGLSVFTSNSLESSAWDIFVKSSQFWPKIIICIDIFMWRLKFDLLFPIAGSEPSPVDCQWIFAQATSAGSKKVSPIALPVLKLAAEPRWLWSTRLLPAQPCWLCRKTSNTTLPLVALILRLEILAAKGGLASHGLEASKDCLSSPSPSPQRKQGGGSRGEEFGPVRASPSGPGSCLQLAPEGGVLSLPCD